MDDDHPQDADAEAREERLKRGITDEIIDDPDIENHPPIELPEEDATTTTTEGEHR